MNSWQALLAERRLLLSSGANPGPGASRTSSSAGDGVDGVLRSVTLFGGPAGLAKGWVESSVGIHTSSFDAPGVRTRPRA